MNRAAESILGVRMTGRRVAEFDLGARHPDGTPIRWEEMPGARVLKTGLAVQDVQLVTRNALTGADVPLLGASAPLRDRTGAMFGAISVFQDISTLQAIESERDQLLARTEAALARLQAVQAVTDTALAHLPSQDLLRQLVARVAEALTADHVALLVLTEDGRTLVADQAHGAQEVPLGEVIVPIGHGSAGRIAATRQPLILADVSPDDAALLQLPATVRSLAGVPVMAQERLVGVLHADSVSPRQFTAKDLELLQLVAERIGLVVENGRLYSEEQRHSAELAAERDRLQLILDMLPEAVLVYDADLRITRVNCVAQQMAGIEIVGKQRLAVDVPFWLPDGTPVPADQMPGARAVRTGTTVRGVRLVMRHPATGEELTTLTSATPLHDACGAITGAVVVTEDISALVALEREREQVRRTEAHDLRNALTSIYGMSQIMLLRMERAETPAHEQLARSLQLIERATHRMMHLVGDLLDSAQAEAGQLSSLALRRTDILALVGKVVEEQQQATDRHRLELQTAEQALHTQVDPERLERALANLVGNAVKYSPLGGRVTVAVARGVGPDGAWLSIAVADEGLGIPAADLPHVFEPQWRGSNVAAVVPGTGFGLADVRRVVELHGGTVELESSEGVGTRVTVRLPLRQDAGTIAGAAS
jgi:signal transduction histidine kinase/putative methionine-R-sulfoxide reductase with GAF domain